MWEANDIIQQVLAAEVIDSCDVLRFSEDCTESCKTVFFLYITVAFEEL